MPKFTFPVPGRRNKGAAQASPEPASKAHRILGTGQLNIDSPASPQDPSKVWDSISTISISVSEPSESHGGVSGQADEADGVEQESGILPRSATGRGYLGLVRNARLDANQAPLRSPPSDSSSGRRRQSSSTIMSYYDKTKVPLVISQQTSASAMAKGLPSKASSLLDMDGSRAAQGKKKKPARLDLSSLLPRGKPPTRTPQKGHLLGPDMMTRSPSVLSVSPSESALSPGILRSARKLLRKSTAETLRGEPQSPPQTSQSQQRASQAIGMQSLYEHYEQMTFRDVVLREDEEEEQPTPPPESPQFSPPPLSTTSKGFMSPFGKPARGGAPGRSSPAAAAAAAARAETPITAVLSPPELLSPADCGASVSSRHTRTSRGSRQTNTSIGERDLHFNSVLSLSSDSEEDDVVEPGLGPAKARRGAPVSPTGSSSIPEYHAVLPPRSASSPVVVRPLRIRTGSAPPARQHLIVPGPVSPPKPPKINPRTSSLSLSTMTTAKGGHRRSSSRVSVLTTSTINSIASTLDPSPVASARPGQDVQEARAITMIPAKGAALTTKYSPAHSRASDQPTPPLSPTSVEFYLRSQHGSTLMDLDQGSLRSLKSLGTLGSGRESILAGDGRFMAVTRQEEQLLAALRQRRAIMRDSTHSEVPDAATSSVGYTHFKDTKSSIRSNVSSVEELLRPPQPARKSGGHDEWLMTAPDHGTVETRLNRLTMSSVGDESIDTPNESVMLYLDQPTDDSSGNEVEPAEPSPDLSDFMDFDDGGSTDSLPSQAADDHVPLQPQAGKFAVPARTSSAELRKRSPGLSPGLSRVSLSPKWTPREPAIRDDDIHVRIVEDSAAMGRMVGELDEHGDVGGIPRPDSPVDAPLGLPIQPADDAAVPRKKAVRISAVGRVGMEVGWWGDDG